MLSCCFVNSHAGPLAIVELVKCIAKHLRDSTASGIEFSDGLGNGLQLHVSLGGHANQAFLVRLGFAWASLMSFGRSALSAWAILAATSRVALRTPRSIIPT
jgi:hypothetical protein